MSSPSFMAGVVITTILAVLSWNVLRRLHGRLMGFALAVPLAFVGLYVLRGRVHLASLVALSLGLPPMFRGALRWWGRTASRALQRGFPRRARRRYQLLRALSLDADARVACRVSVAATHAWEGNYELALRHLGRLPTSMPDAVRSVAANLEAYCLARLERSLSVAEARIEEALSLRPQVSGYLHTRGIVRLAVGDTEGAREDLEACWRGEGEAGPFEAERCYDLARVWRALGQSEYAADYFRRSSSAAEGSKWAVLAADEEGPQSDFVSLGDL